MFLQRDPIGFAAGDINLYAYTWNDPYSWRDPSGLGAVDSATLTAGVIGLAATVTGGCVVTEPCRTGLFGAFLNLLGRIGDALHNDGIPGDEPETYPDNPPVPNTADCDPNDPKCLEEPRGNDNYTAPNKASMGDRVDLSRFTARQRGTQTFRDPKSGYSISKDTAGHGGRAWKLLNKRGNRIYSLDADGNIIAR